MSIQPSKTAALYQEHCALRARHWDELQAVAAAEFPVGAEVTWTEAFGPRKLPVVRRGTVVRIGWCAEVQVASGAAVQRVELHALIPAMRSTH